MVRAAARRPLRQFSDRRAGAYCDYRPPQSRRARRCFSPSSRLAFAHRTRRRDHGRARRRGVTARRRARHAATQHRRVRRRLPRLRTARRRHQSRADAIPSCRARTAVPPDASAGVAHRTRVQGNRARASRNHPHRWSTGARARPRRAAWIAAFCPRAERSQHSACARVGARRERECRRHRDDLLDLGHRRRAERRPALSQSLDRRQPGSLRRRADPPRRSVAQSVSAREHGSARRLLHELAARCRHVAAASSVRAVRLSAADRY